MYTVLIVEDDITQANSLKEILENNDPSFRCLVSETCSSAINLLNTKNINLFFLDISFDIAGNSSENGITLGRTIRSNPCYKFTPIIYITACFDSIQDAINEIGCFRYLLKPYSANDVISAINLLKQSPLLPEPVFRFHFLWGAELSIPEKEILYFRSGSQHKIEIVTANGTYETRDYTLDELEKILNPRFVRCHKSFIVQLEMISEYYKSDRLIKLADISIPIGRKYKSLMEKVPISAIP